MDIFLGTIVFLWIVFQLKSSCQARASFRVVDDLHANVVVESRVESSFLVIFFVQAFLEENVPSQAMTSSSAAPPCVCSSTGSSSLPCPCSSSSPLGYVCLPSSSPVPFPCSSPTAVPRSPSSVSHPAAACLPAGPGSPRHGGRETLFRDRSGRPDAS